MENGTNTPTTPQPEQPQADLGYRAEPAYQAPPMPQQRRRDLPYKQAWLAGVLSGLFPGMGQVYVGDIRQGITIAVIFIVIITTLAGGDMSGLEPLLGMSIGFVWLYGIIDAARRAQAINRALDSYGKGPVPGDIKITASSGSMVGGTLLVVFGVILIANTRFDVDMDWLADWWPLALIGLGGWLIYKARAEKAARDDGTANYDRGGEGPGSV